jgi:putative phage-type endonuclease
MDTKQLIERKQGMGGSDAGSVLGVSKWKSAYQVWLEKTSDEVSDFDNPAMFWGRTLEPVIRQRYSDVTGRQVFVPMERIVHPKYNFIRANVDGITDDNRLLEVKTARADIGWGEEGSDEIPDEYACQVQHYMMVTGLVVADVAVLIGGSDFRLYEVPADKELQDIMMEKEAEFWQMVINRTPPEPETLTDLILKFGRASKQAIVQADHQSLQAVERLKAIKAIAKEEDELKFVIMAHMMEADTLAVEDKVIATWKASNGAKRFDSKAFQNDHPDLYNKYLKQGEPTRRLLLK